MNHKKELLRSLWVGSAGAKDQDSGCGRSCAVQVWILQGFMVEKVGVLGSRV